MRARIQKFLSTWPRPVWVILLGWVINSTGFGMIVPFMSLYFHQVLGIPMKFIGLLFLATAIVRAISGMVSGRLSDRIGRRPLLILAPAGRGITFFVVAFLVHHRAPFFPTAFVIAVTFLMAAAYQPVAQAVVADAVEKNRRLQAYAWTRVAMNLGWALGPAMGGYISQFSYTFLFVIGGILGLGAALLVFMGVPETAPIKTGSFPEKGIEKDMPEEKRETIRPMGNLRPPGDSFLVPLRDKPFVHYAVATLFLYLLMAQLVATLPVYAVEWVQISKVQLGHLFALNGLLVVFLQTSVIRYLKRFSILRVQVFGSLAYALFYFLMAGADAFPALLVLIVGITLAEMSVTPGTVTVVSQMAPAKSMGNYMGVFGLFSSAAWSFGPFIGGLLLDFFPGRPYALWGTVAVLGIIASGFYMKFRSRFGDIWSGS
ncbi:MAG: MFS transporter [Candidatus Eisenbacteria bacterium]|nr:MFS transporter [Candidatus Eisenbacteria bacterium]MBU1949438.1 MFS transporter [Candidatus Eisenbacteria bacterium]